MKASNKKIAVLLFAASLLLVLGSTYIPDICFRLLLFFDYRYVDIRMDKLIHSVQICGILLSLWGIAFLFKEERKNEN